MSNQIKPLLEQIELPRELHERSQLGVLKAKQEKQRKRVHIRLAAGAAALIILGGALTFTEGGSHIVNAAQNAVQTLISQIFGSKDQLKVMDPQVTEVEIQQIEEDLQTAKLTLSDSEFVQYKELLAKLKHYIEKMAAAADGTKERNSQVLSEEEQQEYRATVERIESFHSEIVERTKMTLEEASQLAGYPIRRPTYVPDGYQLSSEEINPKEMFRETRPYVAWKYKKESDVFKGDYVAFYTIQQPINDSELAKWAFDHIESYTLDGYPLEFAQYEDSNVQGMRIRIPENDSSKSYEIVMIADRLPKEQMEQVLLSMVKKD